MTNVISIPKSDWDYLRNLREVIPFVQERNRTSENKFNTSLEFYRHSYKEAIKDLTRIT